MTRRVLRALRWAGKASQENERADKIIKFIVAIECLFINERFGKGVKAAERVARFWTDNNKFRDNMYADIVMYYDLRNNIVHGQDFSISDKDKEKIDSLVRYLVFGAAKDIAENKLLTFGDFLTFVNGIGKTPWKPPKYEKK